MKCERNQLIKALDLTGHATERASSIEALSEVQIEAKDGALTLTTDDLRNRIRVSIEADGDLEAVATDHRVAAAVIKASRRRSGQIDLSVDGKEMLIQLAARKFTVDLRSAHDRPKPPSLKGTELVTTFDGARLTRAVNFIAPAVSADDSRLHLAGICFDEGKIVATDGHRMHIADDAGGWDGLPPTLFMEFPALRAALKACSPSMVFGRVFMAESGSPSVAEFSMSGNGLDVLIQERLTDMDFPPWQQVVPSGYSNHARIDSDLARDAIATAQKISKAVRAVSSSGHRYRVNGALTICATNGAFSETVPLTTPAQDEVTFFADPKYMLDALLPGTSVTLSLGKHLDPIVIDYPDCRAIIMPCRGD